MKDPTESAPHGPNPNTVFIIVQFCLILLTLTLFLSIKTNELTLTLCQRLMLFESLNIPTACHVEHPILLLCLRV